MLQSTGVQEENTQDAARRKAEPQKAARRKKEVQKAVRKEAEQRETARQEEKTQKSVQQEAARQKDERQNAAWKETEGDTAREEELREAVRFALRAAEALHAMPERAYQERETTRFIRAACEACGVVLLPLPTETGVWAWLSNGAPDTVLLRADIDAVPVGDGAAHRCGHDYHTASLLGAMRVLSAHRDALLHNVAFLFQPAEECTSGMKSVLAAGLLDILPQKPARVFGIHNRPEIPVGKIGVHPGALMAEKTNFMLSFLGKAGHGGSPQTCIDPLVAASAFVLGVQTIVSRNVDPQEAAVCSVCSMQAGDAPDLASDSAKLGGSVRTFRHAVHLRIMERVEQLAAHTAAAYECGWRLEWFPQVPAVENGTEMTEIARRAAVQVVGAENVIDPQPCLGSEDFAVLGSQLPSFFYWVGSGAPGRENGAWHTEAFRVADGYLDIAVPLLIRSAMEAEY